MSEIKITIPAGSSKRLLTEGKYCDNNIVVTASAAADDAFWDGYQDYGNRRKYNYAFAGAGWTDDTYNPKYPIIMEKEGEHNYLFYSSGITDTKVDIIVRYSAGLAGMFEKATALKTIRNLQVLCTSSHYSAFRNCIALENITITGYFDSAISFDSSPLLTNASVQSIIDHLRDKTGLTAPTLTFHTTVGGKLTEEQKAAITAKNWTLVY